jgi:hypothetical protein
VVATILDTFTTLFTCNSPDMSAGDRCAICGETAQLRCSRCKETFYCGQTHQKDHWKHHKFECRKKESTKTSSDSTKHVHQVCGGAASESSPSSWAVGFDRYTGFSKKSANGSTQCSEDLALNRLYEWLVDCYRLRVDEDSVWGGNFHGLYDHNESKIHVIVDFLVFLKLAVHAGVIPDQVHCGGGGAPREWEWGRLLDRAAGLLPYAFGKSDATVKYSNESHNWQLLRSTSCTVYGRSAMEQNLGETALQSQLEQNVRDVLLAGPFENVFAGGTDPGPLSSLLSNVGGSDLWSEFYSKLVLFHV